MTETLKNVLQSLFVTRYEQFRKHLRLRLGSDDLAGDALHETYLRVEKMNPEGAIKYPSAYLFRIALNVAEDQRRGNARILGAAEIDELYDLADELADPARTVDGRSQINALENALAELPWRRRSIVIAARVEEMPHAEIARRFNVSPRTVEKELRAGLEHCCHRLGREFVQRYGPGAGRSDAGKAHEQEQDHE
ncbi:RNA polymerase sigma factor [Herbaspirillum robiniae]|uniref:RNA polymerase subunit sigma n=1 Tax=Herbaspirillum robiniae TaxID=2014887 RepID=A0A246WUP8_9BURK|nr:RNA polymerase sigma factor [Herbaspirillum robiniae]OWY30396.1 RNA polymerase subunit sigma [Herbaspirillum robiniae]